jgi:hypothetical protein
LPASWTGLHEAVQKIPDELPRLFADKVIHDESTHEEIKQVIDQVKGNPNFTQLLNHVIGLIAYVKKWPEPIDAMGNVFLKQPGNIQKIEGDDLEKLSEWLMKLDAVIFDYDPDAEPDNSDDNLKPPKFEEWQKRKRDRHAD